MNIEEAKEQLISLKENAKVNIDTDEIFRLDYEAITFVLNELENKNKTIDEMLDYIDKPYRITILGGKTKEKLRKYFTRKK